MYSLTYKVTTSTCDSEGKLKLYSALQMMQDCSEMWIDSEPEVKDYFLQQNMAQLLATRQVEIIRVPDYNKHLNNARSASRRVTLARQELCPHGDGIVAGGFRGSRSSCGISRSSQAWRLSDSYYLQNS